jgi:hypothetical protein
MCSAILISLKYWSAVLDSHQRFSGFADQCFGLLSQRHVQKIIEIASQCSDPFHIGQFLKFFKNFSQAVAFFAVLIGFGDPAQDVVVHTTINSGASCRIRTDDIHFTKVALCWLS